MATAAPAQPLELSPARISNWQRFWREFRRSRVAMLGLVIVIALILAAVFADVIAPYDPNFQDYTAVLQAPGEAHALGTDNLGRDLLTRLIYGARISLVIGFVSQAISLALGMTIGMVSGWYGGWVDDILMRFTEIIIAIPGLMFLIVWVTIFDPGPLSIFLGLGLIGWTDKARLMRSEVLVIKELDYVLAAQALGVPTWRLLLRHVLPNALAPMIVVTTLGIAGAILAESILSFLGLGIQIPTPSWGTMVDNGRNYLPTGKWWYAMLPGLTIMITVLGFNFIGDALRDALDPRHYN